MLTGSIRVFPDQNRANSLDLVAQLVHTSTDANWSKYMGILKSILRVATWWDGQTLNTQFFTWRNGTRVGEDTQGNVFYRNKDDTRRWVIYNGEAEASRVDADWHGWLHHTWDEPPTDAPLAHKSWEKPHQENLTGSMAAYAPTGSLRKGSPEARTDYEAWQPE